MLRTMTNLKTDQKRFTRSNAPTARPQTTGTNLTTRLNEHKRASKKGDLNIAEHHLRTSETIDWDSVTCLTYSTDYYQRQLRPRNLRATRKGRRTRKRRPTRKIRPRKLTGKWIKSTDPLQIAKKKKHERAWFFLLLECEVGLSWFVWMFSRRPCPVVRVDLWFTRFCWICSAVLLFVPPNVTCCLPTHYRHTTSSGTTLQWGLLKGFADRRHDSKIMRQ